MPGILAASLMDINLEKWLKLAYAVARYLSERVNTAVAVSVSRCPEVRCSVATCKRLFVQSGKCSTHQMTEYCI